MYRLKRSLLPTEVLSVLKVFTGVVEPESQPRNANNQVVFERILKRNRVHPPYRNYLLWQKGILLAKARKRIETKIFNITTKRYY